MDTSLGDSAAANPATATATTANNTHIPALTGVRFFAVLHIFMFHLWVLYDMDKPAQYSELVSGFSRLPEFVVNVFSNGWMSTSFFFILSGFILSYLYWGEDGKIVGGAQRFWFRRLARLYPIHVICLLITLVVVGPYLLSFSPLSEIIPSAFATLLLVQAWYPPFVPDWNWPAWTISALLFLYLIMPWLIVKLSSLSKTKLKILLLALPVIALLPTVVYAVYFPAGSEPQQNWQIFIGSTPVFWVAQFVFGMVLSRAFGISRFNRHWREDGNRMLAWGDLALIAVIAVACIPNILEPLKFFVRHGLMMPLYAIIILDFAKGNGIAARLFSLPGTGFLGETAFSLFIWQNMAMVICWITAENIAGAGFQQVWAAPLGLAAFAIISTYAVEKPIARKLRERFER